ncbi:MAG: hypothetical protein MUC60_05090 [Oscillatoria sp. Prado101]|nr:hypothetical protein [Oscillatoria sp. Prado101]
MAEIRSDNVYKCCPRRSSAHYLARAIDFFYLLDGPFRVCRLAIAVTKGC